MDWQTLSIGIGILGTLLAGLAAVLRLAHRVGRYLERIDLLLRSTRRGVRQCRRTLQRDHGPRILKLEDFRRQLMEQGKS